MLFVVARSCGPAERDSSCVAAAGSQSVEEGVGRLGFPARSERSMSRATRILDMIRHGKPEAADQLLPVIYDELRRLAAHKMSLQPPGQTLQATALVHEAFLRLVGGERQEWASCRHFFAAAAEAMRHILIERARRRLTQRRGGGAEHVDVDAIEIAAPVTDDVLLRLDSALEELEAVAPQPAQVVKLRFFTGARELDIAKWLGVSERTVQRQWNFAKAWLFDRIESMDAPDPRAR
jgi:RNA polymerase sigma factor (TIGR02999 family)